MFFYISYLLLFLLMPFVSFANGLPDWVNNDTCKSSEICSVGFGSNLNEATANARSNIQKVFETKIKSSFRNEVSNTVDNSYELLQEDVDGILNGTKISKVFRDNNREFYVLAVLDKNKVAEDIKFDIKAIDEKMSVLLSDSSISSSKKLEDMYKKRESLNKRYLFLTGKEFKSEIKYQNVFDNNRNNFKSLGSYYLNIKDVELKSFLSKLLSENGITVLNTSSSEKIIDARIDSKKEFLNVDGFEKYSITLTLRLIHNEKVIKSVNKKVTETGIDYTQIYSKAMNKIFIYLEENIINIIG